MSKLLIPLLAAVVLPTAVNAEIDKKTAEFCLQAEDFAGCIKTISQKNKIKSEREIVGIGIQLNYLKRNRKKVIVWYVFPEGPASKVGLRAKDKIIKVDGIKIYGMTTSEVSKLIRGEKGTSVVLEISRKKKLFSKTIVRDKIKLLGSKDDLFLKGKLYESSRICPKEEKMRWWPSRKDEVEEIGCMSDKEFEAYRREYLMRLKTRPEINRSSPVIIHNWKNMW